MTGLKRYPEWAPTFDRMEFPHGSVLAKGLAARFRVRGAPVATWRVTGYETCRSFAWESTVRGVHTRANHVIEPAGDGTKLTLSVEMTGFMTKVFAPMLRNASVRNLDLEGNGLKARAEGLGGVAAFRAPRPTTLSVMMTAPAEWRQQTARERELIETVLLADFPGRDEIALQLRGAQVGGCCACGCGSFGVRPTEEQRGALSDGVVFEAEGKDAAGALVILQVVARGGVVDFIECTGLGQNSVAGLPRPETLRAFVEVEPVGKVRNFIPSDRTIIEEAKDRGPTS